MHSTAVLWLWYLWVMISLLHLGQAYLHSPGWEFVCEEWCRWCGSISVLSCECSWCFGWSCRRGLAGSRNTRLKDEYKVRELTSQEHQDEEYDVSSVSQVLDTMRNELLFNSHSENVVVPLNLALPRGDWWYFSLIVIWPWVLLLHLFCHLSIRWFRLFAAWWWTWWRFNFIFFRSSCATPFWCSSGCWITHYWTIGCFLSI